MASWFDDQSSLELQLPYLRVLWAFDCYRLFPARKEVEVKEKPSARDVRCSMRLTMNGAQ